MKKIFLMLFLNLITPALCFSEISVYQSTENVGQNKKERIDSVEKYLMDLSLSLRAMDLKIDESAHKIKTIEDAIKQIKDLANKKEQLNSEEKKALAPKEAKAEKVELEKLKEDILSLKNKDIEKLKVDFDELRESVKQLNPKIRSY